MVNFKYNLDNFNIKIDPVSRTIMPWRDEVLNTAKLIADSTSKPIYLGLSGGIDAEVVARAFIELGIEFTAFTWKHTSGTNIHDIRYAEHFCKKYKIQHSVLPLDLDSFCDNDIPKYIQDGYIANHAYSYQQLISVEMIERLGGCCVLGGGEQIYETVNGEVCLAFDQQMVNSLEWCRRNNTVHYPFFHMHNSELFASYMQLPLTNLLLSDPEYYINPITNFSHEKILSYHRYWKGMNRRPKYDGYEYVPMKIRKEFGKLYINHNDQLVDLRIPIGKIKSELGI
jgi:hypothetical protein